MTPLTFGNHLKFGPNSCHNAKVDLPSSTEREHLNLSTNRIPCIHIERGLQRARRVRPVAATGDRTKAHDGISFFCYPKSRPGVDRLATPLGIDEILAFKAFDKTISFRHWLSKTQKLALASEAFLLKRTSTIS